MTTRHASHDASACTMLCVGTSGSTGIPPSTGGAREYVVQVLLVLRPRGQMREMERVGGSFPNNQHVSV